MSILHCSPVAGIVRVLCTGSSSPRPTRLVSFAVTELVMGGSLHNNACQMLYCIPSAALRNATWKGSGSRQLVHRLDIVKGCSANPSVVAFWQRRSKFAMHTDCAPAHIHSNFLYCRVLYSTVRMVRPICALTRRHRCSPELRPSPLLISFGGEGGRGTRGRALCGKRHGCGHHVVSIASSQGALLRATWCCWCCWYCWCWCWCRCWCWCGGAVQVGDGVVQSVVPRLAGITASVGCLPTAANIWSCAHHPHSLVQYGQYIQ